MDLKITLISTILTPNDSNMYKCNIFDVHYHQTYKMGVIIYDEMTCQQWSEGVHILTNMHDPPVTVTSKI
jgi:hypothetical protein